MKPKPLKIEAVKGWPCANGLIFPLKFMETDEKVRIIGESDFRKLLAKARRAGKVEVK